MNTRIILLMSILFSITILKAQPNQQPVGHLTIFSEDGDRFFLILNGERINDTPQTNLRVEDLNQPYYNAKIIFENQELQPVSDNNMSIVDVDNVFVDVTYKIKRDRNNKSKLKLRYFSSIPVQPNFIPPSSVHVIHYGKPVQTQNNGGYGQATTTTTTTTNQGVNMGVNIGGVNMGVGVSINTPVTTTSTTISSSSSVSNSNQSPNTTQVDMSCNRKKPIAERDFNSVLASIKKQSFDDIKLKTSKQILQSNCYSTIQIKQMANLFSFEENKLEFAKYAYDFCVDTNNYYKINDIFSFSTNVDILSDYVQDRMR